MGHAAEASPVLLFCGFLFQHPAVYEQVRERLRLLWGREAKETAVRPFVHTDYYEKEMGGSLKRSYIVYDVAMNPGDLVERKLESNRLENEFAAGGGRRINIDPGYLHPAKLVLASTKDFTHRIYLGRGIYGEVTLRYMHGTFEPLEWTYPDYKEEGTIAFLNDARKLLFTGQR